MELSPWHIWMIAGIILFILEIFTPALVAACLGIGCLAAGLISLLSIGLEGQLLTFSIATAVSFFGVRPFMLRYGHRRADRIKTNADALVGKYGRVLVEIDNHKAQGRVAVEGDDWRAESLNDVVIPEGTRITVVKVDSTILIVKLANS